MDNNEVGKTKDVGFEIGVRKTIPVSPDEAWNYLFSKDGVKLWLGELTPSMGLETGKQYQTSTGVAGTVKVLKHLSHIRLTWRKKDWSNTSTLQIRVIQARTGTTISFHQECLLDSEQREAMKLHWTEVLEKISKSIK